MFCKIYDRIKTEEKALTLDECPAWVEGKRAEYGELTQVKKFSSVEFHHAEEGKVLDIAPMYPPQAGPQHDAMYQKMIAEIHDALKRKETAMKIKYEACTHFGPKIRKVEVVSETKAFVVLKEDEDEGYRRPKIRPDRRYFDTFKEAKHFLEVYFAKNMHYHQHCLETAKSYVSNAKGLKDSEVKS